MTDYKANFSLKLRETRLAHGLTQHELADRLGFSEKTVSKWECGASVPDIDTLFRIAELFGVGLPSLFDGGERYALGIDGGGTKTDLWLSDRTGKVLRRRTVGASNPMDIGFDAACAVLKDGIRDILEDTLPSRIACFAGLAGGGNAQMRARFAEFFRSFGFFVFDNDSDTRNVIAATLGEADGVAVILGTGICAFTQRGGERWRTGGWGYMIDGGGSAYDLGRDALRAYFHSKDGCGPASALTEEVEKLHPTTPDGMVSYIYTGGKRTVASFAPAVFSAIERGDKAAMDILERSMHHAAHIIRVAAKELPAGRVRVHIAGGLTHQPSACECLRRVLDDPDRYDLFVSDVPPVEGAVALACKLLLAKETKS